MTTSTPSTWPRRIGVLVVALMIFVAGWGQGELAATQRLADALEHVAPSIIQVVRDACPRDLDLPGWSQDCLDLVAIGNFYGGEK